MIPNVVVQGARLRIEFVCLADGSSPAEGFLRSQKQQARLWALFHRLADCGHISNREHFKKLDGDFFEFKSFQIRMPCYYMPGGRVVVTHGFIKKKDAVDRKELERARRLKDSYESLVANQKK